MTKPTNAPHVLIIRDGWGTNPNPDHARFDGVALARTPVAKRLMGEYPWTLIKTCGEDVGLPEGTMGNSEVGHQNIGAGRVVPQESLVMTRACGEGLQGNPAIRAAIERCVKSGPVADGRGRGPALHLMGINSDAGVHGLLEHLYAILRAARDLGLREHVYVHLFADGRDTGPYTGITYARQVEEACVRIGVGRVASVVGRYYAMDRDHRWERVARAYRMLVEGHFDGSVGHFENCEAAFRYCYDHPTSESMKGDEFVEPCTVGGEYDDRTRVRSGDSVIFYNYRGDRPRELSAAFCLPDDAWGKVKPSPDTGRVGFDRGKKLDLHYVTMTDYWTALTPYVQGVAFPKPPRMKNIAGEHFAALGLRQFRCAETEKYPHVTFFFNDYRDEPFPGESRAILQSPKVATYDRAPEMSASAVRDAVLGRLRADDCEEFIVVNFANGDMVGHTGVLDAVIKACETVDACVGEIVEATLSRGGSLIVTADHGNAEQMFDPATGSPHTAHTLYDVPLILVSPAHRARRLRGDRDPAGWFDAEARQARGRLADILPTSLAVMGLPQPAEMTGESLLI